MKNNRGLIIGVAMMAGFPCYSQGPATTNAGAGNPGTAIYNWFSRNNISIRKSFEGSKKDEEKPANFFWGRDIKNDHNYTLIDVGVKIAEVELFPQSKSGLLVFPKFEWHKDGSNVDKLKNTLSGGLNVEFFPSKSSVIWFLGSADYQNDKIKELETWKPKLMASLFSTRKGFPGSSIRYDDAAGSFLMRYYPYSGFEGIYSSGGKGASYWASRIFLELNPMPSGSNEYVQLTFDYSYRVKLKDNLYNSGNADWFAAGVNIYPDGKGKIGFGLEYNVGEDPGNNFVSSEKVVFGLKLKL
jgi:hypothetical protein